MTDERLQEAINQVIHSMHGYDTLGTDVSQHQRRFSDWDQLLIDLTSAGWRFVTPEGDDWVPPIEARPRPPWGHMITIEAG